MQIPVTEIRKANEIKARFDSATASGRLILIDLKAYQDSTIIYKDSAAYWQQKAAGFKRKRNRWRTLAIFEAIYISLSHSRKL